MRADPSTLANNMRHMHFACMPSITIRDVPKHTRDELAARAALGGLSLQEYLRTRLIELAERPDSVALVERIRRRKRATGSVIGAAAILEQRDADRR